MKKNIIIKMMSILLIIVLIILIITIRLTIKHESKNLTEQMYKDICEKKNYTFSMTERNENINYILTVSKKENSMSIDSKTDDEHTTTLVKDGYAYYVMHPEKEYYLYDSSQIDADILKSGLSGIENEEYSSGYERINNKKYYYEEYEGLTTFIILSNYNEATKAVKTRFYFDENKIVYIKTMIDDFEELLKIEFLDEVDDNSFEIPDDYAEI